VVEALEPGEDPAELGLDRVEPPSRRAGDEPPAPVC